MYDLQKEVEKLRKENKELKKSNEHLPSKLPFEMRIDILTWKWIEKRLSFTFLSCLFR